MFIFSEKRKNNENVSFICGSWHAMNAIENNEFSDGWVALTKKIHRPKDILVISAHWYTDHLGVNDQEEPEQIYDMYGFPKELYELKCPVKGSLDLAENVQSLLGDQVSVDNTWGIDHGTWSVLKWMYPEGDIPVVQLSINKNLSVNEHYELGQKLSALRDQGTLIVGSGNVVHNLRAMDYHHAGGYPWAVEFDYYIKEAVINHNHDLAIHYQQAGDCHKQAFYTLEHFLPLIYVLGAANPEDSVTVFNESCFGGSLSMTSYLIGT